MSVNGISSYTTAVTTEAKASTKAMKTEESNKKTDSTAVIYEAATDSSTKKTQYANPDLVAKLKQDAEQRTEQLRSLVEKTILKQSQTFSSIWEALASGTLEFDEETIKQAQEDISEDGYWGVNQTSDRIISFAQALAGDDPAMLEKMRAAFKKGYGQATQAWGKELPDLSSRTYDAVMEKFDKLTGTEKTND